MLFSWTERRVHFPCGNLLVGRFVKTQITDGQAGVYVIVYVADGWTEGTAEDWTMLVEVARLRGWIEDGTCVHVGPFFEALDCVEVVGQDAR